MSTILVRLVFFAGIYLAHVSGQSDYVLFGTAKIGETCERDFHCIEHSFCRSQMTCLCEPFYAPWPDFSKCIATVGLFCDKDEICSTMTNAECRQGICACKDTYSVDITNSSNCLAAPTAEHDSCQRNDQCIEALDRALCIDERCECLTSHHFGQETRKCIRHRGIFDTCTLNEQCYTPEDPELLECRDGTCKCKPEKTGPNCSGAAANRAGLSAVLFLLAIKSFT